MIKAKFPIREFNSTGYITELSRNVVRLRDVLAREFIRTTLEGIPVWSGASQATLIPLSQLVKATEVIPTRPIRTKRKDEYHGIEAGITHGSGKIGEGNRLMFEFSHDIRQFLEQEWGDKAIQAGSAMVASQLSTLGPLAVPAWTSYLRLTGK